jgi:hypothetical protein
MFEQHVLIELKGESIICIVPDDRFPWFSFVFRNDALIIKHESIKY